MPWPERSTMSLRTEFVELAQMEGSNIRALCRRFGISPKTGYKWLGRYRCEGSAGLMDRPRRPRLSPRITNALVERALLDIRDANPAWGARKICHVLAKQQSGPLPAPSTVTAILRRNGRLDPEESTSHTAFVRFEHEQPNDLWQMDFKGDFALANGRRCHPLTMLDDHARYCLLLAACSNEKTQTVQALLIGCFRTYGLPEKMLMDNGPPWGGGGVMRHTALSAWLMRLGILVCHGCPWHPQTQGKEERFHRTLTEELLRPFLQLKVRWNPHAANRAGANRSQSGKSVCVEDHDTCQMHFDRWRSVYNDKRPHEAIGMQVPVSRYQPSQRAYPEDLPAVEYDLAPGETVRTVDARGAVSFKRRSFIVGVAFHGQPVALRPTCQDGLWNVYFCTQRVGHVDLRTRRDAIE